MISITHLPTIHIIVSGGLGYSKRLHSRPQRRYGQNFMIVTTIRQFVVEAVMLMLKVIAQRDNLAQISRVLPV